MKEVVKKLLTTKKMRGTKVLSAVLVTGVFSPWA
jgi:hypothetical protein